MYCIVFKTIRSGYERLTYYQDYISLVGQQCLKTCESLHQAKTFATLAEVEIVFNEYFSSFSYASILKIK